MKRKQQTYGDRIPTIDELMADGGIPTADELAAETGCEVLAPPPPAEHRGRLNRRQAAFARAIADGLPRFAAQLFCGYSPNRAHALRLLRDPKVRRAIKRRQRQIVLERGGG